MSSWDFDQSFFSLHYGLLTLTSFFCCILHFFFFSFMMEVYNSLTFASGGRMTMDDGDQWPEAKFIDVPVIGFDDVDP